MINKQSNLGEFKVEQLEQRLEMREWDLPTEEEIDNIGKPKQK